MNEAVKIPFEPPKVGQPIDPQAPLDWADFYFESTSRRRFWVPHPHGVVKGGYIDFDGRAMKNYLMSRGVSGTKGENQMLSAADKVMQDIMIWNRVDYAGLLGGYQAGVYDQGGVRALVTQSMKLLTPKDYRQEPLDLPDPENARIDADVAENCPGFPVLGQLMKNLLSGIDEDEEEVTDQRPFFTAWLAITVKAAYQNPPKVDSKCPALVIAGEADTGKSRLLAVLVEMLGHRKAWPYRYLIGRDSHNSDLAASIIQAIDDENSQKSREAREEFKAGIKQFVAADGFKSRAMGVEGRTLFPLWRLVILLNLEPDDLRILPPIDDGFADKVLLLKGYKNHGFDEHNPMPMPTLSQAEKDAFWGRVRQELPYYLHWLLYDYEVPRELQGRFGVRHFHHPQIIQELSAMSKEFKLLDYIDRAILEEGVRHMKATVEDIKKDLTNPENTLHPREREEVGGWEGNYIGRMLSKLTKSTLVGPERIWQERGSSGGKARIWHILQRGILRADEDPKWAKQQELEKNDSQEVKDDS
jgi:hypothetical protein